MNPGNTPWMDAEQRGQAKKVHGMHIGELAATVEELSAMTPCEHEVSRDDLAEPCGKPYKAWRIDTENGGTYPACEEHQP